MFYRPGPGGIAKIAIPFFVFYHLPSFNSFFRSEFPRLYPSFRCFSNVSEKKSCREAKISRFCGKI